MTGWLSPAADAALRSVHAPVLPSDFTDRIMARLETRPAPMQDPRSGWDRRGPWKRGRIVLLSGIAAGLISVGAAATGLFGVSIRNLPVVGTFVERIAPTKIAKAPATAKPVPKRPAAQTVAAPVAEPVATTAAPPPPLPLPGLRREIRREIAARRIADRIDQRAERREALGLPPHPKAIPPQLRERLRAMPPAERAALVRRVREIRAERAPQGQPPGVEGPSLQSETDGPLPTLPRVPESPAGVQEGQPETAVPRERLRDRMTPEQRQKVREMRERRRVLRERQGPVRVQPQQ